MNDTKLKVTHPAASGSPLFSYSLFYQNWNKNENTTQQSKKDGKGQESIQLSTTHDPGYQWESDKFIIKTEIDMSHS